MVSPLECDAAARTIVTTLSAVMATELLSLLLLAVRAEDSIEFILHFIVCDEGKQYVSPHMYLRVLNF